MPATLGETTGWLRAAVGVALLVAPGRIQRLSGRETPTAVSLLLLRTIGIRDLALGSGTVRASRQGTDDEVRRWTAAGLCSDSLDVVASLASVRGIGRGGSVGAATAALLFAAIDVTTLRRLGGGHRADALRIRDRGSEQDPPT